MFEKGEIETKSPPKKIYEMINTSKRILGYHTGSTNNMKKRNTGLTNYLCQLICQHKKESQIK